MPCIHGLDEMNCPTCRIIKHSIPNSCIKINDLYNKTIKPENLYYKTFLQKKEESYDELKLNLGALKNNSINVISNPNLLNQIPDFKNKMFLERMKEIDVFNSEVINSSKKIPLKSPELKIIDKE